MSEWVALVLGAAVGAPARYLLDRAVQRRHDGVLPWGTLVVNVLGSLVLGLLVGLTVGLDVPGWVTTGLGTGFCGALTTYSTFGYETLRLAERGRARHAVLNVVVSLVAGLAAAALGLYAGDALGLALVG